MVTVTTGSDVGQTQVDIEVWENVSNGLATVPTYDKFGNKTAELVRAGTRVRISRTDRENQEMMVRDPRHNVFRNGVLRPITISDEALQDVGGSPNILTDAQIVEIFKLKKDPFIERISQVDHLGALNRLIKYTEDNDNVYKYQIDVLLKHAEQLREFPVNEHKVFAPRQTEDPYAGQRPRPQVMS